MTYRKIKKRLATSIVVCIASPVIINCVGDGGIKASATVGTKMVRSGSIMSRTSSLGSTSSIGRNNSLRPGNLGNGSYKLSKLEKTLGGISIGVGAISVLGTAIGLGLTEGQFNQSKKTYEDVVDRTYNSFYDERQKYMEDLFSKWGVPVPDKYKNPLKGDKEEKPTPGFSFG